MVLMDLFGGRNEDIHVQNTLVNPVGEGVGGMNWAVGVDTYILLMLHTKQITQ